VKLWSFGGHVDGLVAVLGYLSRQAAHMTHAKRSFAKSSKTSRRWLWTISGHGGRATHSNRGKRIGVPQQQGGAGLGAAH
jgi:hypothetical protein